MTSHGVDAVLAAYDEQLRRSTSGLPPGWRAEMVDRPAPLLRLTSPEGTGWGDGVVWSDLDESSADAAIAGAVEYFGGLGRAFEWKHHGYDRPADLPDRLRAAGFEPEPQETLLAAEASHVLDVLADAPAPEGVVLRHLRGDERGRLADWNAVRALHEAVWDEDGSGLVQAVSAEQAADREGMSVHLAEADDGTVACACWVRFHAGTDFASLWGGSTLPTYRRRGIYKALVARRAREAADRGFRYLQVDASDDSRPILERLGFRALTSTTPYVWRP